MRLFGNNPRYERWRWQILSITWLVYERCLRRAYLILFWAPVYLNTRLGTRAFESGVLGATFELAGPLSVLAGGYLSDKVFHCKRICGVAEPSDPPVPSPDYGSATSMCFVSKTNPATWA